MATTETVTVPPSSSRLSLRSQDYLCPVATPASCSAEGLFIDTAKSVEPLSDIIGKLRKLKHSKKFLDGILANRDKQLYPRDLLVAYVPTKSKKGTGQRAVGILRRSLKYDKEKNRSSVYIDFVWVMPEARGQRVGKKLLLEGIVAGKQKDVRLMVAGSDSNRAACALYESVGFRWDEDAPPKTEMVLNAELVPSPQPSRVPSSLCLEAQQDQPPLPPPPKAAAVQPQPQPPLWQQRRRHGESVFSMLVSVDAQLDCSDDGAVAVRFELRVDAPIGKPAVPAVGSVAPVAVSAERYVREERTSGCAAAA